MPLSKARDKDRKKKERDKIRLEGKKNTGFVQPMSREEAGRIVLAAFGRRPDLPSGKDYVDEVRGHTDDDGNVIPDY